ncbi:hypothetical protein PF011_g10474 [Phytophthora fragariae]|uniref:Uncharacterized protein n=1 Tax=Phytophthora fragariae TaxID=53985 RepID=A0A6A3KPB3_9STRA|nr:hypothetical protein PF011_g10474 [Phytophthora fragariae]
MATGHAQYPPGKHPRLTRRFAPRRHRPPSHISCCLSGVAGVQERRVARRDRDVHPNKVLARQCMRSNRLSYIK